MAHKIPPKTAKLNQNAVIASLSSALAQAQCAFFVVSSNICLPAAFPRSYVRTMQPILQRRSKLFINIFSLYLRMCAFFCTFAAEKHTK